MGFLKPKVPKPAAPPNPAVAANSADLEAIAPEDALAPAAGSLIATSARGLQRRANTQRTSLIGGG